MNWVDALRCPRCTARGLAISPPATDEPLPAHGAACCAVCGARLLIRDHILDLAPHNLGRVTLAGLSNFLPLLPWGYETVWRPRALTLLTGAQFSIARELSIVNEALGVQPHELIVDLGSSTDLYARGVAHATRYLGVAAPTLVAIDIAPGMLRAGRAYARRAGVRSIAHVRANVERLPFADATVDALVCGGSLNEFRSMASALREARRVVAPRGRMVAMSLLAARTWTGKLAQGNAHLSGIQFPSLDTFNATLRAAGWRCERQQIFGVVAFTLMKPLE